MNSTVKTILNTVMLVIMSATFSAGVVVTPLLFMLKCGIDLTLIDHTALYTVIGLYAIISIASVITYFKD